MDSVGTVSYGLGTVAFLALSIVLALGWRGHVIGFRIVVASLATTLAAGLLAAQTAGFMIPAVALVLAEILRDGAWLVVLTSVAQGTSPRALRIGVNALWIALALAVIFVATLVPMADQRAIVQQLYVRGGLVTALAALVLIEQFYRNAPTREGLKYFVLGVGGLFAFNLFLYSEAELFRGIDLVSWQARGVVHVPLAACIALAVRRQPEWSLDVFVSRHVVFYTTSFIGIGGYLIAMAIGGYYLDTLGGGWGELFRALFLLAAAAGLLWLTFSAAIRRRVRVFLSKHFYRNKYDYRIEWLRFIETLSSTGDGDVRRTALRAVAQIFDSPGGVLYLSEEGGRRFVPVEAWPLQLRDLPAAEPLRAGAGLTAFIEQRKWIVDLAEYRASPDVYGNAELPDWLLSDPRWRIVSPIFSLNRLTGLFVLFAPPPPFELTFEDRDLLNTAGRHVATLLAQQEADQKLAESRQFEAYNRLTAFMMHDLKNSVAQLSLIVRNADRHKHNPEFIDDTISTVANTAERVSKLIEHLRGIQRSAPRVVDLAEIVETAAERCSARKPAPRMTAPIDDRPEIAADPDRLAMVFEHVIRNAQDATSENGQITVDVQREGGQAVVIIEDTGSGMDAEFIRERLFRPFDSTKGAKGMGIGAYQVREYVRMIGGDVEVRSGVGRGTRFAIFLPLTSEVIA